MRHIVCAGYTSRDRADAERHIQELGSLGIARPQEVPIFFAVASYLATVDQIIEVQGPFTSGEVEVALVLGPGGPWVTVASDQTDRFVERHSVPAAKQLCPKVVASTVWPLADVEDHWDELELRAWVRSGRTRRLYQEARLGSLLPLATLLASLRRRVGRALDGVILLSERCRPRTVSWSTATRTSSSSPTRASAGPSAPSTRCGCWKGIPAGRRSDRPTRAALATEGP